VVLNKLLIDFTTSQNFSLLNNATLLAYINQNDQFIKDLTREKTRLVAIYDSITREIQKRPLLTLSASSTLGDSKMNFFQSELQFIQGLGTGKDSTKPWDFYFNALYKSETDTTTSSKSLARSFLNSELGINKILIIDKAQNLSRLEIAMSANFKSIFSNLYVGEDKNTFELNLTLTTRIGKEFLLPIQLKYNPKGGSFFGILNFKWDLFRNKSDQ
jgi:hypothetical protein